MAILGVSGASMARDFWAGQGQESSSYNMRSRCARAPFLQMTCFKQLLKCRMP